MGFFSSFLGCHNELLSSLGCHSELHIKNKRFQRNSESYLEYVLKYYALCKYIWRQGTWTHSQWARLTLNSTWARLILNAASCHLYLSMLQLKSCVVIANRIWKKLLSLSLKLSHWALKLFPLESIENLLISTLSSVAKKKIHFFYRTKCVLPHSFPLSIAFKERWGGGLVTCLHKITEYQDSFKDYIDPTGNSSFLLQDIHM